MSDFNIFSLKQIYLCRHAEQVYICCKARNKDGVLLEYFKRRDGRWVKYCLPLPEGDIEKLVRVLSGISFIKRKQAVGSGYCYTAIGRARQEVETALNKLKKEEISPILRREKARQIVADFRRNYPRS